MSRLMSGPYAVMFGEGPYDTVIQKGDSVALDVQTNSASCKAPGILYLNGSCRPPRCRWTPSSTLTILSSSSVGGTAKPRSRAAHYPNLNQPVAMLRRWHPCLGNRPPTLTGICILSIQACSLVVAWGVGVSSVFYLFCSLTPENNWIGNRSWGEWMWGMSKGKMMQKKTLSRMAELASWSASKYGSRRMYK